MKGSFWWIIIIQGGVYWKAVSVSLRITNTERERNIVGCSLGDSVG